MNITRMRKDTHLHDFNQKTPRGCYPRTVIIFTSSIWRTKMSTNVGSHLTKYFHRQYSAIWQIRTLRFSPKKMSIDAVSILAGLRNETRNNKWTCWPHDTHCDYFLVYFPFGKREVELDDVAYLKTHQNLEYPEKSVGGDPAFKQIDLFLFFMRMSILPVCKSVYHVHAFPWYPGS